MLRYLLMFLALALPVKAEEVIAGLSQSRISIATDFDGSEILIFGAVKRDTPAETEPLQVIVTVEGPSEPLTVRKKDKRFGIWVNTSQVDVIGAPSFYAVATTAPMDQTLNENQDLEHSVSIARAIKLSRDRFPGDEAFEKALIRIRETAGLYQTNIGAVTLEEGTLFSTSIRLPANLHEGDYRARFFLTRGGEVIDTHTTDIDVQKVGLERFLFRLSRENPLLYGLMSLAIAIFAGWAASAAFRVLRV
ncbi:MAG: TIGR02186 family protein [Paracoccaceae bacterium]|uniref:TIGR02186 family protein n=1 Tax=Sulfitobacter pontiacus TaxID=60137 RepID=UPI00327FA674